MNEIMKRQSLELPESDWQALAGLAKKTKSTWNNKPSWRTLLRRIARGEVTVNNKTLK